MSKRITLKPRLRPVAVDEGVFIFGDNGYRFLASPTAAHVVRGMLAVAGDRAAVAHHLRGRLPEEGVHRVLDQMIAEGVAVEQPAGSESDADLDARYAAVDLDVPAGVIARVLGEKSVVVRSHADGTGVLVAALEDLGVRVRDDGDLTIVHVRDMLDPGLDDISRTMLREGRNWLLVRTEGRRVWLTLFVPGGACWHCLAQRLRTNRRAETYVEDIVGQAVPPVAGPVPAATLQLAGQRVAGEVVRWLVTGRSDAAGVLVTIDVANWKQERHVVSRLVHCPACGEPPDASQPPDPPVLQPRPKSGGGENGSRTMPAGEAFARCAHHISPLTGVVRDLRRLDSGAGDLTQTYAIAHPLAYRIDSLRKLEYNERHQSFGKGRTPEQAMASALFEGIERFSGVWREGIYRVHATLGELGADAVSPASLLLYSARQYHRRHQTNATCIDPVLYVPEPFDEGQAIDWVPAWSLTHMRWRYVPAAYAYYDVYPPVPFCVPNSNGCAAGMTLEEAIVQGFLELAERDALSVWWYNRLQRPGVDLDSFDDPYFTMLHAYYARLGRRLWMLDLTHDLGVPAFAALSRRETGAPGWIMGFGCHLDAHVAAGRALTEVSQLLPAVAHDEAAGSDAAAWHQTASEAEHPYLVPVDGARRVAAAFANRASDDLRDDVRTCVALAAAQGLEVLVIDQTHPDLRVPVVRVMCPGLVPHWRRLGGDRLYEVPVRMGWRDVPLGEDEMNPLTIVL